MTGLSHRPEPAARRKWRYVHKEDVRLAVDLALQQHSGLARKGGHQDLQKPFRLAASIARSKTEVNFCQISSPPLLTFELEFGDRIVEWIDEKFEAERSRTISDYHRRYDICITAFRLFH